MAMTQTQRLGIFLALALVMTATRVHLSLFDHDVCDASWAVFFLAGFWLRGLVPLGVSGADGRGRRGRLPGDRRTGHQLLDRRYCVSVAYWFLIPAYFCLWMGGSLLARHQRGLACRPWVLRSSRCWPASWLAT